MKHEVILQTCGTQWNKKEGFMAVRHDIHDLAIAGAWHNTERVGRSDAS